MSAVIHIVDGATTVLDEPQSRKHDTLPLPSTTGSDSVKSGLKLFQILHYLNPLFYARLVQAYIQTVLRSYSTANHNDNARITYGEGLPRSVEVVRGTTVDNCFTTASPEFEYACRLGLDGALYATTSASNGPGPLSDVNLQMAKIEDAKSAPENEGLEGCSDAQSTKTTAPTDAAMIPASTQPNEQNDKAAEASEGKRARKAKRGKGKGKGKP
ncbi:hypothetical protein IWW37_005421 [Coemansia sp. RSA 2050]|nr:hypothetical protein IWW37_005421 [Coemansia sp. RSA 2050]KAJ2729966.1 hypothetical protein IW152_005426 [Coemansia sp. BCRC 34962]